MKSKKTLISILLSLTTLIVGTQPFYANELPELPPPEYTIQDGHIIDNNGNQYYNFVDASGQEVSLEEALLILNSETLTEEINTELSQNNISMVDELAPIGMVPSYSSVTIATINKNYIGAAEKVSPDFRGPLTMGYETSTSVSRSVSGSLSVSAQRTIWTFLSMEFSVSLGFEITQTDTYSVSDYVNENEIVAVYFKPYYVRATGTYNGYSAPSSFTAYYPKLMANGHADGLFYLVRSAA